MAIVRQERIIHTPPAAFVTMRRIIYFVLDVLAIALMVRFLFRAFAANPATPLTGFIYDLTGPLVAPFSGLVPHSFVSGFVIEWTTLIAIAAYIILAAILLRLFRAFAPHISG